METSAIFSPEDILLLDGLWDDDDEDNTRNSAPPESSVSSVSPAAAQLEEKLLSIERGADVTTEVLGHIWKANNADLDAILAKEMAALSVQERDYVIQDMHGIAEEKFPEDDNNFLQQRLQELEGCLTQIDPKPAYNLALYQAPDYVRNDQFRLLFLRGGRFNVQTAAHLMVSHLEEKQRLFGDDLLGRDIRLDDLSDVDRREFEKGFFQILPVRDRAGRIVVCLLGGPLPEATSMSRQRSIWYVSMTTLLQDEDASKKGIVVIILNLGPCRLSYDKFPFIMNENKIFKLLPLKAASLHYCFDDPVLYPFLSILRFIVGSRARGRLQTHYVTQRSDYIYRLQTYGIPSQVLPMDEHDIPTVDYHLQWIKERQIQESSSSTSRDRIAPGMIPRRFDVLFGRGATIAEHTGNLRAFHIVEMNRERYDNAGKFEKTLIADRVVHLIYTSYGRFLRKEPGGWVEVSIDAAREKISHCFRRLREVENRTKPGKNNSSHNNSNYATKRDGQETSTPNIEPRDSSSVDVTKRARSSSSISSS